MGSNNSKIPPTATPIVNRYVPGPPAASWREWLTGISQSPPTPVVQPPILSLPTEIVQHVTSYLTNAELAAFSQLCRQLYSNTEYVRKQRLVAPFNQTKALVRTSKTRVGCIYISNSKIKLCSVLNDNTLRMLELSHNGSPQVYNLTVNANISRTELLSISPDGNKLVTYNSSCETKLICLKSGNCISTFKNISSSSAGCLTVISDQNLLACGEGKNIQLYDLNTGTHLRTLCAHTEQNVVAITTTADSKYLVSASDTIIKIWDFHTANCIKTLFVDQHLAEHKIKSLAMTPDGKAIISITHGRVPCLKNIDIRNEFRIYIWDVHTGNCIRTFEVGSFFPDDISDLVGVVFLMSLCVAAYAAVGGVCYYALTR